MSPLPRVLFVDACVLYPAPTRDLFMELALDDLVRLKWSQRVHEEWMSNLLQARPELDGERIRTIPLPMQEALAWQEPLVEGYEHLVEHVDLPDEKDRHVVAAAFWGGAEAILTFNTKDFPQKKLEPWELVAMHPDTYLLELTERLVRNHFVPSPLLQALRRPRQRLVRPPLEPKAFLQSLEGAGLKNFAKAMAAYPGKF
ncbi:PIN domain-containing protein [Thermus sp.]|uniref:PIN domain-containing protein n=1 Tax=Thermus sp. TaxID=275 RepID=UPI0025EEC73C|nr:PIN domain-containing protein [Thermus sp.]MCS6867363.1 PIN domain-containing protein [Thermus sp.]MDW8357685.1 PIN domain-containing protein [Thermus sp.]